MRIDCNILLVNINNFRYHFIVRKIKRKFFENCIFYQICESFWCHIKSVKVYSVSNLFEDMPNKKTSGGFA